MGTFDGRKFDAQAGGEAIFLKTLNEENGLEVQARLEKIDRRGNPAVTTGIAVRGGEPDGPIVQVSIPTYEDASGLQTIKVQGGRLCPVEVLVDGERQPGLGYNGDSVKVTHNGKKISVE